MTDDEGESLLTIADIAKRIGAVVPRARLVTPEGTGPDPRTLQEFWEFGCGCHAVRDFRDGDGPPGDASPGGAVTIFIPCEEHGALFPWAAPSDRREEALRAADTTERE